MHQEGIFCSYLGNKRAREEFQEEFDDEMPRSTIPVSRVPSTDTLDLLYATRSVDLFDWNTLNVDLEMELDQEQLYARGMSGVRVCKDPQLSDGSQQSDGSQICGGSQIFNGSQIRNGSQVSQGTGQAVDDDRFKLVAIVGYRRSLDMAASSKHVASGVPFVTKEDIDECLVTKPDVVHELLSCF